MKIEIVNKEGELITDYELESNPFEVGQVINIKVINHNKDIWNIDDINGDYKVEKIEHYLRKHYGGSDSKPVCSTSFCLSVEVTEIL